MPAITVDNTLVLPRIARPDPATSAARPVDKVITAHRQLEGAGISIRRPFPGELSLTEADPFLLLDQGGPHVNGPGEAKGAPWHPHRGFETVTYILDGAIRHTDSNGGGGVITDGATQWMTGGAQMVAAEVPGHPGRESCAPDLIGRRRAVARDRGRAGRARGAGRDVYT